MSKLVYGRNGHVRFVSESEKQEAFRYLRSSSNVIRVHEDNDEQGAWAPEERIHFKTLNGVPEGLLRNMTAGRGSIAGRINCKELIEDVWGPIHGSRPSAGARTAPVRATTDGVCCQIRAPLGTECMICGETLC